MNTETQRENLRRLMQRKDWNAYALAEESGVPQPTIHRFLAGTHGELRESTVRKLAGALGVTEEQFRGLASLDAPTLPTDLNDFSRLTPANQRAVLAVISALLECQS